jgi:5-methylcytosine-specific restriction protein A
MAKLTMLKPRIQMAQPRIRTITQTRNPEAEQRIRGRRWMEIRAKWFRDHPLCAMCEAKGLIRPANRLDHIIPLVDGGKDDESNYQSLCDVCHKDKTAAEARDRG